MQRPFVETASTSAPRGAGGVTIKSPQELELMRRAGAIVGRVLRLLIDETRPGVRTKDLDALAAREIKRMGGKLTFKGYRGFPATICASVNEEIVHGIPGDRVVKEGDLLKLDVGATYEGFVGDAA